MPADGNCLFSALAVGHSLLSIPRTEEVPRGNGPLTMPERAKLGETCRNAFLAKVTHRHQHKLAWADGSDLTAALDVGRGWPSVEEYLERMKFPITHRRQWGGYGEALLLSHEWKVVIAFFAERAPGQYFLLCEPVSPPGANVALRICLLWKVTHYDLLSLPTAIWDRAVRR